MSNGTAHLCAPDGHGGAVFRSGSSAGDKARTSLSSGPTRSTRSSVCVPDVASEHSTTPFEKHCTDPVGEDSELETELRLPEVPVLRAKSDVARRRGEGETGERCLLLDLGVDGVTVGDGGAPDADVEAVEREPERPGMRPGGVGDLQRPHARSRRRERGTRSHPRTGRRTSRWDRAGRNRRRAPSCPTSSPCSSRGHHRVRW